MDLMVSVVLPAGGTGQRMKSKRPKQYIEVGGKPLICYSIEAFERIPWVKCIVISISTEWQEFFKQLIKFHGYLKVVLAKGENFRHQSVYAGIKELSADPPQVVIIHDAVRPFIEETSLRDAAIAAKKYGAAGLVRPLTSTVISKDDEGFLLNSLDRSKYFNSEMPQAFNYDVIYKAYQKCSPNDFEFGTECLHLVMKYEKVKPKLVDGPDCLWKVTQPKDLFALKAILQENAVKIAIIFNHTEVSNKSLCEALEMENYQMHGTDNLENIISITEKQAANTHISLICFKLIQINDLQQTLDMKCSRRVHIVCFTNKQNYNQEINHVEKLQLESIFVTFLIIDETQCLTQSQVKATMELLTTVRNSKSILFQRQTIDLTN